VLVRVYKKKIDLLVQKSKPLRGNPPEV